MLSSTTPTSVDLPTSMTLTFAKTLPYCIRSVAMEGGQLSDRLAAAMTSVNLPSCTTPAAIELVQFNDRDRLAATLISLVRAEAKDEADAEERQPPPGRRQSKAAMFRNSQWMPEHLIALLPPPSNNEQIIRIFWNHVRTNSQHWPVCLTASETFMFISAYNTIASNGSSKS